MGRVCGGGCKADVGRSDQNNQVTLSSFTALQDNKLTRMMSEEAMRYTMYASRRRKILRERMMAVMMVPMPSCDQACNQAYQVERLGAWAQRGRVAVMMVPMPLHPHSTANINMATQRGYQPSNLGSGDGALDTHPHHFTPPTPPY